MKTRAYYFTDDEIFTSIYQCANCNGRKVQEGFKHCPDCGSEIDEFWGKNHE